MNKKRLTGLVIAWVSAIVMVLAITLVLQVPGVNSQGPGDSERESDKALAAEQQGPVERDIHVNPNIGRGGVFPLFVGVADTAIPTYLIDPTTNLSTTAFVGLDVWSAAYDPVNDRILFSTGVELHEWPIGGTVNTLGNVTDGSGNNLSIVGLAFYNDTLYGYTASQTEGIWSIDPSTQVGTLQIATVGADTDCGGLSADPSDGTFYCTSDDTSGPGGAGLYIVNGNGSLTFVDSYPSGETDVDGLTIGTDGYAYLVTDDDTPQEIYVYDLAAGAYTTSLVSPWPAGDQLFSAGAWIYEPGPGIDLVKTVGIDPNICATTNTITVNQGTQVTYCFDLTNTGPVSLTVHDLDDSQLGTILSGFPFTLTPGASVFVTQTTSIFFDTTNTATWTACNIVQPTLTGIDCSGGLAVDVVSGTAQATVNILPPSISLSKTVGTDPNTCATTSSISVPAGTDVTYCYDVTNTGGTTLTVQELDDSQLGTILSGFPFTLTPGASVFVTQTANITSDTVNVATWTACNIDGPPNLTCFDSAAFDVVSDTATANVTIIPPSISLSKTVGTDPNTCATTSSISVLAGTDVTYCYDVTNTGATTLTVHDLDDSQFGTILSGFPFTLTPGASAFVTQTANITTDTVNVATWTACNIDGPPNLTCFDPAAFDVVSDTATANVTVMPPTPTNPSIALTKTVGLDNSVCATSNTLMVGQPSTEVYYCYTVMNTGDVTFTTHDLFDDKLGTILSSFPFVLGPGASTSVFPVTETITTTVTNVATWTASVANPTLGPVSASATASATVTESPTAVSLNSFTGGNDAAMLPIMVGLLALLVFGALFLIRRIQTISDF